MSYITHGDGLCVTAVLLKRFVSCRGKLTLETVESEELWLFPLHSGEELLVRDAHK